MAEIQIEAGLHEPLPSNGMDTNYWYASAIIDGAVHTDAAGPTVDLALYALAKKLATQLEAHEGEQGE